MKRCRRLAALLFIIAAVLAAGGCRIPNVPIMDPPAKSQAPAADGWGYFFAPPISLFERPAK